ncbi:MAG: hypothetical protein KatS3mg031_2402 [Chitinophagales bacterium]|nr:MAG: hypothetical protein KatS3mg031_2402 [Chitinophagales bacterium]
MAVFFLLGTGLMSPSWVSASATIKGTVKGALPKSLRYLSGPPEEDFSPSPKPITVAGDGFTVSLSQPVAGLIYLLMDDTTLQLYVHPNDTLEFVLDTDSILIKEFKGRGAADNSVLNAFTRQFGADFDIRLMREKATSTESVDKYESDLFNSRLRQMKFLKEAGTREHLTPAFRQFMEHQITYNYFRNLFLFASVRAGQSNGLMVSPLPSIMLQELGGVAVRHESAMNSPAYRGFLREYVLYYTAGQFNFAAFSDYTDLVDRTYNYALRYLSGEPFVYWLAATLDAYCDRAAPSTVKKLYKALEQADQGKRYVQKVTVKCRNALQAKETKAKPEEDSEADDKKAKTRKSEQPFTLLDLKGREVYLEDFKGKVVYVDFWASWCGPCRQQFPYAKALKEMLTPEQRKQVVFLYISIDDTDEKWKKAIEQYQIEGFHTRSPGGWGSSATRHFGVSSIPRYMLIDKQGNVVDPNAKRPSSGQAILQDILMLL